MAKKLEQRKSVARHRRFNGQGRKKPKTLHLPTKWCISTWRDQAMGPVFSQVHNWLLCQRRQHKKRVFFYPCCASFGTVVPSSSSYNHSSPPMELSSRYDSSLNIDASDLQYYFIAASRKNGITSPESLNPPRISNQHNPDSMNNRPKTYKRRADTPNLPNQQEETCK